MPPSVSATPASTPASSQPWWSFGHVWLVLAGPAIVVVAGFVTFYIAARTSDTLVDEDYYRKGVELSRPAAPPSPGQTSGQTPSLTPSLAPAMTARNHAQTGAPVSTATPAAHAVPVTPGAPAGASSPTH